MSDVPDMIPAHDPLCLYYGEPNFGDCTMCGVIAATRTHERERIARALLDLGYDYPAQVARNGGSR